MSTVSEILENLFLAPDNAWSEHDMRFVPQGKQYMFEQYANSVPIVIIKRLYNLIRSIDDIRSQVKSSTRSFNDSTTVITDRSTTYVSLFDIKNLAGAIQRSIRPEWDVRIYAYIGAGFYMPAASYYYQPQPSQNNVLLSLDMSTLLMYLNSIRQANTVEDLPDPPVTTWLHSVEMVVQWCEFIEDLWNFEKLAKSLTDKLSQCWNIYSANGANSISTLPSTRIDPLLTGLIRSFIGDTVDSYKLRLTDLNTRSAFGSVNYHDVTFNDLMLHVWTQKTASSPVIHTRFPNARYMRSFINARGDEYDWYLTTHMLGRVVVPGPDKDHNFDLAWFYGKETGAQFLSSTSLQTPLEVLHQITDLLNNRRSLIYLYPEDFNYTFPTM